MALASSRRLGAVMAKRQSGGNGYCPMSGCADAAVRPVTVPGPEIDKGGNTHKSTSRMHCIHDENSHYQSHAPASIFTISPSNSTMQIGEFCIAAGVTKSAPGVLASVLAVT